MEQFDPFDDWLASTLRSRPIPPTPSRLARRAMDHAAQNDGAIALNRLAAFRRRAGVINFLAGLVMTALVLFSIFAFPTNDTTSSVDQTVSSTSSGFFAGIDNIDFPLMVGTVGLGVLFLLAIQSVLSSGQDDLPRLSSIAHS